MYLQTTEVRKNKHNKLTKNGSHEKQTLRMTKNGIQEKQTQHMIPFGILFSGKFQGAADQCLKY